MNVPLFVVAICLCVTGLCCGFAVCVTVNSMKSTCKSRADCDDWCRKLQRAFLMFFCGVGLAIGFAFSLPMSLVYESDPTCGVNSTTNTSSCPPSPPPAPPVHPDADTWHSAEAAGSFALGLTSWVLAPPAFLLCIPALVGWMSAKRTESQEQARAKAARREAARDSRGGSSVATAAKSDQEIDNAGRDLSLMTTDRLKRWLTYLVNVLWAISLFGFLMAISAWRMIMRPVFDGKEVDWTSLYLAEGVLCALLVIWLLCGEWLRRKLEEAIVKPAKERYSAMFSASQQLFYSDVKERLAEGSIRLLSCAWLANFEGGLLPRCQDLPPEAFLSEADALRAYDAGLVFVTSHGWYTALHPDPEGHKLRLLQAFCRNTLRSDLISLSSCGLFLDYCSLPQKPRSASENVAFGRGLSVMGRLYGSLQTHVVQIKEMPPRPAEYDGDLCVWGLDCLPAGKTPLDRYTDADRLKQDLAGYATAAGRLGPPITVALQRGGGVAAGEAGDGATRINSAAEGTGHQRGGDGHDSHRRARLVFESPEVAGAWLRRARQELNPIGRMVREPTRVRRLLGASRQAAPNYAAALRPGRQPAWLGRGTPPVTLPVHCLWTQCELDACALVLQPVPRIPSEAQLAKAFHDAYGRVLACTVDAPSGTALVKFASHADAMRARADRASQYSALAIKFWAGVDALAVEARHGLVGWAQNALMSDRDREAKEAERARAFDEVLRTTFCPAMCGVSDSGELNLGMDTRRNEKPYDALPVPAEEPEPTPGGEDGASEQVEGHGQLPGRGWCIFEEGSAQMAVMAVMNREGGRRRRHHHHQATQLEAHTWQAPSLVELVSEGERVRPSEPAVNNESSFYSKGWRVRVRTWHPAPDAPITVSSIVATIHRVEAHFESRRAEFTGKGDLEGVRQQLRDFGVFLQYATRAASAQRRISRRAGCLQRWCGRFFTRGGRSTPRREVTLSPASATTPPGATTTTNGAEEAAPHHDVVQAV